MSIFRRIMLGGGIGIDAIPDSQKIYYKATAKVTPMSNSLGVTILTNNWNATTGEGIIICGSNIKKIEDDAFYNRTSLTSINIPDSVTTIGDNAFSGCASLVSITIPNSVTSIGDYAFSTCTSLESVTIPDSVTEIGITIFSGCTSLTSIIVSEGNSIYDSRENCNAIIKTATNELAIGCNSTIIPNSVTSIGDYAFNWCTILTSINIPDIVTTIGRWAFYSCKSLTSVTIPDSVTSIGSQAFDSCNSLTSVYCKATTPPSLGWGVFANNSSDRKIYVPTDLVSVYRSTAGWRDYASAIVGYDFENDEIEMNPGYEIWYTSSDGKIVTPTDTNAFGVNITSNTYTEGKGLITFDGNVTSIGDEAFSGCETLKTVTISDSVTTIGNKAFSSCRNLTSATIGDSITEIGERAFYRCDRLTSITIPDSVETIADGAFYACDSLTEFNGKFASEDGRCLIVDGVLNSFAPYRLTEYTIPDGVTKIGKYAFQSCSLTSIIIPDSVTEIEEEAFSYSSYLTSITLGEGVTTIGNNAFYACVGLASINIPNSVTKIGKYAFWNCNSLTSINIPNSITEIGDAVFELCTSLTSVTIPDSVTKIGKYAFSNCESLTSITIPDSVTEIGVYAFTNCFFIKGNFINNSELDEIANDYWGAGIYDIIQDDGLCISDNTVYDCKSTSTAVIIPNNITSISSRAMYNCRSLTSVTIPDSVTTIGDYAVHYCDSLTSIYCKATIPPALGGSNVFDINGIGRKIYVPTESVDAYKSAEYWSEYANAIVGYDFENNTVIK